MITVRVLVTCLILFMVCVGILKINNSDKNTMTPVDVVAVWGIVLSFIGVVLAALVGIWSGI